MEEDSMRIFCKSMGTFCGHLQSSCDALKQSVDRRPIPLDSASSTFIQCLNRRVSISSTDLNMLESMSFGTVSFEELLGHCNEVYKKTQNDLLDLQDRLKSYGYVPEMDIDEDDNEDLPGFSEPMGLDLTEDGLDPPSSYSIIKSLEEDPLLDDELSLKNLGISDVCLATLASEAHCKTDDLDLSFSEPLSPLEYKGTNFGLKSIETTEGEVEADTNTIEALRSLIKVSREDYEGLPSYMKILASWEELIAAVDKINLGLNKKENTKGCNYFHQDEITSLGLGPKGRSYLLLLMRMNQLVVETINGLISYRVL